MANTTATVSSAFLPAEAGPLIIRPVQQASVAATVATTVVTGAAAYRIPIVSSDPAAGWVAEGAEIAPSDATLGEVAVPFRKVAGLSIVSNELLADASPDVATTVGQGLARDIARKIDTAFYGNTTTNAPNGIRSITTSTVSAGGSWDDLDPFTAAVYAAEAQGATLTSWVANPADALALAQIKVGSASNASLLDPDPTQPARRLLAGLPLIASPAVAVGTVWGVPTAHIMVVIRNDVDVQVDKSVYFTSDRAAIRATLRVGFAFPHPLGIVAVTKA